MLYAIQDEVVQLDNPYADQDRETISNCESFFLHLIPRSGTWYADEKYISRQYDENSFAEIKAANRTDAAHPTVIITFLTSPPPPHIDIHGSAQPAIAPLHGRSLRSFHLLRTCIRSLFFFWLALFSFCFASFITAVISLFSIRV